MILCGSRHAGPADVLTFRPKSLPLKVFQWVMAAEERELDLAAALDAEREASFP
jgi:hypothetical protein